MQWWIDEQGDDHVTRRLALALRADSLDDASRDQHDSDNMAGSRVSSNRGVVGIPDAL